MAANQGLIVSETVLAGLSRRQDVVDGMRDVDSQLALERGWHDLSLWYTNNYAIGVAAAAGKLEQVTGDDNFSLIRRFRNPVLHSTYPPFLKPSALDTLRLLGSVWRQEADDAGVPGDVKLSVTSLTRSVEYQRKLVAKGLFAVTNSTHLTGYTFDVDLSGYFVDPYDSEGHEASITMRPPDSGNSISQAFEVEYDAAYPPPIRLGPEHFDQRVPETLLTAAALLFQQGLINMVPEMYGTPSSALHISTPPNYSRGFAA